MIRTRIAERAAMGYRHPRPTREAMPTHLGSTDLISRNLGEKIVKSKMIDFPKISRFREAGKYTPPAYGGNPEILEKL